MSHTMVFYKAGDGTAATAMDVSLVSGWTATKLGQPVSFQMVNGAGTVGAWSLEGTNDDPAVFGSAATAVPASLYWYAVTQPSGSAGTTSITIQATHAAIRARYTRASGGAGVAPAGRYELGAGGVLVIPPDAAVTPAASIATLAAIAAAATVTTGSLSKLTLAPGVLGVAASGVVESDGTHLYWTTAGGSRKQLD